MLVKVKIWTIAKTEEHSIVFVRPSDTQINIPIFFTHKQAKIIFEGIDQEKKKTNFVHLFLSVLDHFSIGLKEIYVLSSSDRQFTVELVFEQQKQIWKTQTKLAYVLALAVRHEIPLYIDDQLMKQGFFANKMGQQTQQLKKQIKKLEGQLMHFVQQEKYEKAAKIRDEISSLRFHKKVTSP